MVGSKVFVCQGIPKAQIGFKQSVLPVNTSAGSPGERIDVDASIGRRDPHLDQHATEQKILSEPVYVLCFVTCSACAALFVRSWVRVRLPLLLWSAWGFTLMAASNGLLLLDKVSLPDVDLAGYRLLAATAGVGLLIFGLAREVR